MSRSIGAIFLFVSVAFSNLALAELNCQSAGTSSCKTTEGFCVEFIKNPIITSEIEANVCERLGGLYSASPCDQSKLILTCVNKNNQYIPLLRFDTEFGLEQATQMCDYLGGSSCNQ